MALFRFNIKYFFIALVLLIIEVLIALFVHDTIVRPYVGDLIVVILIYAAIRSVCNSRVIPTSIAVLLFAFIIEALQYMGLIYYLGLHDSTLANIVLGNSFEWIDMIAYTAGFVVILLVEKLVPITSNRLSE